MTGVELIKRERLRQVAEEGHDAAVDDGHVRGELLQAAVAYAKGVELRRLGFGIGHITWSLPLGLFAGVSWPWQRWAFKPEDDVRDLVRAGALIAAEIDRLQRQETSGG